MNLRPTLLALLIIWFVVLSVSAAPRARTCTRPEQPPTLEFRIPFWARPGDTLNLDGFWYSHAGVVFAPLTATTRAKVTTFRLTTTGDSSLRFVLDSVHTRDYGSQRTMTVLHKQKRRWRPVGVTAITGAQLSARLIVSPFAAAGVHATSVTVDYQPLAHADSAGQVRTLPPARLTVPLGIYVGPDSMVALRISSARSSSMIRPGSADAIPVAANPSPT